MIEHNDNEKAQIFHFFFVIFDFCLQFRVFVLTPTPGVSAKGDRSINLGQQILFC